MIIYLNVDYSEKDEAKALGAQWDSELSTWYYNGPIRNFSRFSKWLQYEPIPSDSSAIYLDVPISEKDEAKELGAKWNSKLKTWYYDGPSSNFSKFYKWLSYNPNIPEPGNAAENYPLIIESLRTQLEKANILSNKLQSQLEIAKLENHQLKRQLNMLIEADSFPLFSGCNTKEKLQKRYRFLCKLFHPDNNISIITKNFQEINSQYHSLLQYYDE